MYGANSGKYCFILIQNTIVPRRDDLITGLLCEHTKYHPLSHVQPHAPTKTFQQHAVVGHMRMSPQPPEGSAVLSV